MEVMEVPAVEVMEVLAVEVMEVLAIEVMGWVFWCRGDFAGLVLLGVLYFIVLPIAAI